MFRYFSVIYVKMSNVKIALSKEGVYIYFDKNSSREVYVFIS